MAKKLTFEGFLERAHAAQGNRYTYDHVHYINTTTKVMVTCPKHGDFPISPKNLFKGRGCPKCNKVVPNTTETFIEKARKVHGDKYDYSKVVFTRNRDKVTIICPKHGEFVQEANSHLQGHGCPKCFAERLPLEADYAARHKKSVKTNLKKYGTKNPMQNAAVLAKNIETKRKNGTLHSSKPEQDLFELLKDHFGEDNVKIHYCDDNRYPWVCDFYIPSRDMFIELNAYWTHGNHWFNGTDEDKRIIVGWKEKYSKYYQYAVDVWTKRDVKKRETARNNGLNYVVFWARDLDDAKMWLVMDAPDGKDYTKEYSWLSDTKLLPVEQHYRNLTSRTISQAVRLAHWSVFYAHEIQMWNDPECYIKGFPLRAFLFMNRFKNLKRSPVKLSSQRILSGFALSGIYSGNAPLNMDLTFETIDEIKPKMIVDPFAGWGERALASLQKGIGYFGYEDVTKYLPGYVALGDEYDFDQHNITLKVDGFDCVTDLKSSYDVITNLPLENSLNESVALTKLSRAMQQIKNAGHFCLQVPINLGIDVFTEFKNNGFVFKKSILEKTNNKSGAHSKMLIFSRKEDEKDD